MNGAVILVFGAICFALAYRFYGRFLERLFGINPNRTTPAHALRDGVDYVPTKVPVLFGHHFASIAGAGPIVGPIAALYFGWLPVVLWIVFGCIFVGAVHDFAALFLSVRSDGRSIGNVIEEHVGYVGRQIFLLFCWAALVLVVAVFAILVAKTFVKAPAVATASLLFVAMAPVYGWLVYRKGVGVLPASAVFVPLLFACVWVGGRYPLDLVNIAGLDVETVRRLWLGVLLLYIFVASVIPVWLLLQPRDYLNSYLLYAMILLGFAGILVTGPAIQADALAGWSVKKGDMALPLLPLLFVTVACGACSGFHALVASGTSSKQLDNERHICPVGYGSVLIEGLLALMAVISVAYLARTEGEAIIAERSPVGAFASGLAVFCGRLGIGEDAASNFFTLAISAFLLTTLDTATRLTRFTWQELFLPPRFEGERVGGVKGVLSNRFVATGAVVAVAGYLAYSGDYKMIWPVFGASNQLLAALTLLVVSMILIRRKAQYFVTLVPMAFMMVICIWALVRLFRSNLGVSPSMVVATGFLLLMSLILVAQSILSVIRISRSGGNNG